MEMSEGKPAYYVGIGASAGGLEAIEQFIANVPENCNYAVIIVQHLSPDYKSMMAEILSKKTSLPVLKSEDGMFVKPGHIYLIPPKKNLRIYKGKLYLDTPDYSSGINFPIDIFLRSLAEDQGEKAIGVILSGTGSDGVRGIRAIKQAGGIIFVQDQISAKFDGMPKAAMSTGIVDFVMQPSEMPAYITSVMNHPVNIVKMDEDKIITDGELLNKIFLLIREKHFVDFSSYKPSTIARRIERRMVVNKLDDINEYYRFMLENPNEVFTLFKEFLIGVTSFFRDVDVYTYLRENVISEILSNSNEEIRIWVAGCSTGEEAYSIAINFKEVMEKIGKNKKLKIFATDIDKKALQTAASGIYPESITADVPIAYISKYFVKHGNQFVISRSIRESIVFAEHNLLKDPPFTNIALLSCRNILIYLKPEAQKKVFDHFHFSLKEGGILVLGSSETPGDDLKFHTIESKLKIFKTIGHTRILMDREKQPNISKRHIGDITYFETFESVGFERDLEKLLKYSLKSLSGEIFKVFAIVNENMQLLYTEGELKSYFEFPTGKPNITLEKVLNKKLSIPISNAVRKVFRTEKNAKYNRVLITKGKKKTILSVDILFLEGPRKTPYAILVFRELPESPQVQTDMMTFELSTETENRIKDLENELQITKESLQATIEELETSNEELQAANEELLASNEELQSTNEELQSTNEELYTVNNELQSKIIEKSEVQKDLENVLIFSDIGLLILDNNFKIRKFSPKVKEIFNIIDADINRSITHLNHFIKDIDPFGLFARVMKNCSTEELEIQTITDENYYMKVVPFKNISRLVEGIVVTFTDITNFRKKIDLLSTHTNVLKNLAEATKIGGWYFDIIANKMYWTSETYVIHGLEKGELGYDASKHINTSITCYEDPKMVKSAFEESVKMGKPYDITVGFKRFNGEKTVVKTTGNPVIKDGRIIAIAGTLVDLGNQDDNLAPKQ